MNQDYQGGDRIIAGSITGVIIEVLPPKALPNYDEPLPRYVVQMDNGATVELHQNALSPAIG